MLTAGKNFSPARRGLFDRFCRGFGAPRLDGARARSAVAQNVQTALELAEVESLVAERRLSEGEPFPSETAETMRRCDAAILILAPDECGAGGGPLADGLQLEVGVAFALYERRVVLLSGDGVSPPAHFNRLRHYKYEGDDLSWETGIQLLRLIKKFRDARPFKTREG
ncbi:MAG TPA: hypothetical protein VNZ44_15625 [Pyrinomonadaceae bacterium]|nr:hypothetical protein [Pyrinomonadaceae bacterium]